MKTQEEEILDHFLYFEDKYDLFHSLVENGVRSWHYIRFWVYMELIKNITGRLSFTSNNNSIPEYECSYFEKIINSIKRLPIGLNKKDILVFNHPRRVKYKKYYKCIYTDEWLRHCDFSYYVFEEEYNGTHLQPVRTKNLKYFNIDQYGKLLRIKKTDYEKKIDISQINNIIINIEKEFNITFSKEGKKKILEIYKSQLQFRDFYLECYIHLFEKIQPKVLILPVAYNYHNMLKIEVAKKLGIKTIELEHGIISKGHIAYNFYKKYDLPAFPDYIFTFGKYDVEVPRFPFPNEKAIAVGSTELECKVRYYARKLNKLTKKKRIITFLSDNNKDLIQCAIDLSEVIDRDEWNIKLKLHPSEYQNWKKYYPALINSKVQVCDDSKHNIYYYLATSDYVVGSSSTTVFEATKFDCQILILAVGAYFRSLDLVESQNATLVNNFTEIKHYVENKRATNKYNTNYYFTCNSIDKINLHIQKIINAYL